MKNRPRPSIPLAVQVAVAERQLSAGHVECTNNFGVPLRLANCSLQKRLDAVFWHWNSQGLAKLHLDHNPPLRVRAFSERRYRNAQDALAAKRINATEFWRRVAACYTPNANDPDHLIWRTAEAHRLKTNVRGDGAQFPDRVLIKRERRRENKKQRTKMRSPRKIADRRLGAPARKSKIPPRPFAPRGSRPLGGE